jgi:hypothetical protein
MCHVTNFDLVGVIGFCTQTRISIISKLDNYTSHVYLWSVSVTWGPNPFNSQYFDKMPRTEKDARKKGWTKISECDGELQRDRLAIFPVVFVLSCGQNEHPLVRASHASDAAKTNILWCAHLTRQTRPKRTSYPLVRASHASDAAKTNILWCAHLTRQTRPNRTSFGARISRVRRGQNEHPLVQSPNERLSFICSLYFRFRIMHVATEVSLLKGVAVLHIHNAIEVPIGILHNFA